MWGYRERIGGSLRASLLLGVSTAAMLTGLTGCGWFESSGPVSTTQVRPGAEQSVAVSASLPSGGSGRQYDAGITAVDETRGPPIGSIVAGKGGQQAQKDELAKTELENDRKARAESERQLAERKATEAAEAAGKSSVPAQPASPPAPPEAAVPPPAPVTTTPVPPLAPATEATPPATPDAAAPAAASPPPPPPEPTPAPVAVPPRADAAPSPAPVTVAAAQVSPANPNKAFEPPAGWVPPGQTAPVQSAAVQKESFQTVAATEPAAVASPPVPTPLGPTPAAPPPPAVATVAAAPASPGNPNKAFVPPPGWVPPGQTTPVQTAPGQTAAISAPAAVMAPAPQVASVTPPPTPGVTTAAISAPPGGSLQVAVIQFDRASADLGGDDGDILRKIAEIQKQNGGTVRVVAHAAQDASGLSADQTERGNYEVSRRRALAVANHLMALGVPRSAIIAEAASDSQPIYATNSPRGIAANRRAEIFLDL